MADFDQRKDYDEGGEEVYSRPVRAGRRTYFFDVKATRSEDYYLTITESRKKTGHDGSAFYEKHKIFLYKEDFDRFAEGLTDVIDFVKRHKPEFFAAEGVERKSDAGASVEDHVADCPSATDTAPPSQMSIDEEFDSL